MHGARLFLDLWSVGCVGVMRDGRRDLASKVVRVKKEEKHNEE